MSKQMNKTPNDEKKETARDFIKSLLDNDSNLAEGAYDHYMRKIEVSQDELIEFLMGWHDIDDKTKMSVINSRLKAAYT